MQIHNYAWTEPPLSVCQLWGTAGVKTVISIMNERKELITQLVSRHAILAYCNEMKNEIDKKTTKTPSRRVYEKAN